MDANAKETGNLWRASSVGPDNLSDFHNVFRSSTGAFNPKVIQDRNPQFVNCIYDPTNGTVSRGDFFICNKGFIN